MFTGNWSGIPMILINLILGLTVFTFSFVIASRIDKKFAPHIIIGLTVGILMAIISMNSKIVAINLNGYTFPLVLSSFFFPVLALSMDTLNEHYGVKSARALLYCSVITQFMMWALLFWFAAIPSLTPEMQNTFINNFTLAWRGFFASIVAYGVGQLSDIFVFSYLRKKAKGKLLWLRIVGSTAVGLVLDVVIYTSIVFIGVISFSVIIQMMFISTTVRLTLSLLQIPYMYLLKWLRKKKIFLVDDEIC